MKQKIDVDESFFERLGADEPDSEFDDSKCDEVDLSNVIQLRDSRVSGLYKGAIEINSSGYKSCNLDRFLSMDIPPRGQLLSPWLPEQGLAMVFAPRGVGKTFFALNVAYAVASGGEFLGWKAEKPRSVLYIDGEMVASDMQQRLKSISESAGGADTDIPFHILTPDLQEHGMPNLAELSGQQAIEKHIEGIDLIVVDNIACLCRCGSENEVEAWQPVQQWALSMRAQGRSVLFVHHSGKSGKQRGTSSREDVLDTVIQLKSPADYTPEDGARFEVSFTKHRSFFGQDAAPFEVSLCPDENDKQVWLKAESVENTFDKVIKLFNTGMSQANISRELDVDKSTVSRHVSRARSEGRLNKDDVVETSDDVAEVAA